jgi:hypothetical protein
MKSFTKKIEFSEQRLFQRKQNAAKIKNVNAPQASIFLSEFRRSIRNLFVEKGE